MPLDTVKALRGENKRLQCLVAKLTARNETMSAQLKQQEDTLAKRRCEVAVLHRAFAKYKKTSPPTSTKAKQSTITTCPPSPNRHPKTSSRPAPRIVIHVPTSPTEPACLRCPQTDEKLSVALAEIERLRSVLAEKETTIATLAEKDRISEERRRNFRRALDAHNLRMIEEQEATMREMADMRARNQLLSDEYVEQQERQLQQRILVIRRRRQGVADGG